jgi:hypothetical protein
MKNNSPNKQKGGDEDKMKGGKINNQNFLMEVSKMKKLALIVVLVSLAIPAWAKPGGMGNVHGSYPYPTVGELIPDFNPDNCIMKGFFDLSSMQEVGEASSYIGEGMGEGDFQVIKELQPMDFNLIKTLSSGDGSKNKKMSPVFSLNLTKQEALDLLGELNDQNEIENGIFKDLLDIAGNDAVKNQINDLINWVNNLPDDATVHLNLAALPDMNQIRLEVGATTGEGENKQLLGGFQVKLDAPEDVVKDVAKAIEDLGLSKDNPPTAEDFAKIWNENIKGKENVKIAGIRASLPAPEGNDPTRINLIANPDEKAVNLAFEGREEGIPQEVEELLKNQENFVLKTVDVQTQVNDENGNPQNQIERTVYVYKIDPDTGQITDTLNYTFTYNPVFQIGGPTPMPTPTPQP